MGGRKFFVVGNWKSNVTDSDVEEIVESLNKGNVTTINPVGKIWSGAVLTYWWPEADVVVSPPDSLLLSVMKHLRPDFHLAAQNCAGSIAVTGEVSTETLNDLEVPWVILGHPERRVHCGEIDVVVVDKVAYALCQGLKVIACVGETPEQRKAGSTMEVVVAQTKAIADYVKVWDNIVLAYVPACPIGTDNRVASPAQVQEVHCRLRKWLHSDTSPEIAATTRIIYGGSVNGANSKELAGQPDVDGFLVGEASLKLEFIDIINAYEVKKAGKIYPTDLYSVQISIQPS